MQIKIKKLEKTYWTLVRYTLYLLLMMMFVYIMSMGNIGLSRLSRTLGTTVVTFMVVGTLSLNVYGNYDLGRRKSRPIVRSLMLATVCTDIVTYIQVTIMRNTIAHMADFRIYNIGLLILTAVVQWFIIEIFVYGGHWLYFRIHKPERCCVITSSQKSLDIITNVLYKYRKQYSVVDVVDYKQPDLKEHIQKVNAVFIYDVPSKNRARIMRRCYQYKVNVYFNPQIEDVMEFNAQKYLLDDVYLFNKNVKEMNMEQRIAKRLMDISLSFIGIIITSPIWIIAMIAIKLEDGGPIIFKQERATLNGRKFTLYKLRTMKVDAEIKSAGKDDDRITRPGHFLRRTRIDELPQLWNVLKGDMCVVGPRPEMIPNVVAYTKKIPEFEYRLRMKAGLTGYAQIEGKYNTLPKDKLNMDMMYMEQFTIWRDIQLIFQTIIVLLKMDSTEGFDTKKRKQQDYIFKPYVEEK